VNVRLLGAAGIAGGVAYTVAGMRLLVLGIGEDRLTDVLGVVWAACWVLAGWALLRLRVTGGSVPARAASGVLVLGFTLAVLWGSYRLLDPVAADRSPVAVAPLVVIAGMLGTGILVLRAARWHGWSRFLPLATATVYIAAVAASVFTGRSTLGVAFTLAGLCYIAMGHVLWSGALPELRRVAVHS
jgi:hypothetical protein